MKQANLREFLNLELESNSEEESQYDPQIDQQSRAIQPQWSRVVSFDEIGNKKNKCFDIKQDLNKDKSIKVIRKGIRSDVG